MFIIQIICCFFIVRYALRPERAWWGRLLSLAILGVGFVIPYGGLLHLGWGSICWASARAGE